MKSTGLGVDRQFARERIRWRKDYLPSKPSKVKKIRVLKMLSWVWKETGDWKMFAL